MDNFMRPQAVSDEALLMVTGGYRRYRVSRNRQPQLVSMCSTAFRHMIRTSVLSDRQLCSEAEVWSRYSFRKRDKFRSFFQTIFNINKGDKKNEK